MHVAYSCVVDKGDKFERQAYLWARSLIELAGVKAESLHVHAIGESFASAERQLKPLGISVHPASTFDPRHLYSNKLCQLDSEALISPFPADYIVLCDCDIAFVRNIDELLAGPNVKAKQVDWDVPDAATWARIGQESGLEPIQLDGTTTYTHAPTPWNNCNGGLYIFPRDLFSKLAEPWKRWDRWLIDRLDMLGDFKTYADQISFALAMNELGLRVDHLDPIYNVPTHHVYDESNWTGSEPAVLHYHNEVDENGLLKLTGNTAIDRSIGKVNDWLSKPTPGSRKSFLTRLFGK